MSPRLALVAAAMLLAVGCARTPVVSDGIGFRERQVRLDAIDAWEMRGRLAIDTGERAVQARFRWRQEHEALSLTVRGIMLGAGSFRIDGSPEALTVTARGESRVLTDPEEELSRMFGWWLPVTSLPAWLLGLPDPGFAARIDRGPGGTVKAMEQRAWMLDYFDYQLSQNLLIPRSMELKWGTLALRLNVDDFEPLPGNNSLN
jgi:outer membrane lipoprotein LolB